MSDFKMHDYEQTLACKQTRAYQRLLYSARFQDALRRAVARGRTLPSGLRFATSLDFSRARIEQQSRLKNLTHALKHACPFLLDALGSAEFRACVGSFADSPRFFQPVGRNLTENFCLYAYTRLLKQAKPFMADVARLDGVVAGIAASRPGPSPWQVVLGLEHGLTRRVNEQAEYFSSKHLTLDGSGHPCIAAPAQSRSALIVTRRADQLGLEVAPCL